MITNQNFFVKTKLGTRRNEVREVHGRHKNNVASLTIRPRPGHPLLGQPRLGQPRLGQQQVGVRMGEEK